MEKNKSVLVTGCSSGLGKQIAYFLREKGWKVYPTARRPDDVDALKKEHFDAILLDLNSTDSIESAFTELLQLTEGSLTAIVNNAGYYQIGAVEDLSRENVVDQFETNVFGPLELTSKIIPLFRKQRSGRIVFISSVIDSFVMPFLGAYCASKYSLGAFSSALRRELLGSGIYVTVVCPGRFKTNILYNAMKVFYETINLEKSIYKDAYKKLIDSISNETSSIGEDGTLCVARTVFNILMSIRPKSKVIVPFKAHIRYMMHKFLPECIQDFLFIQK